MTYLVVQMTYLGFDHYLCRTNAPQHLMLHMGLPTIFIKYALSNDESFDYPAFTFIYYKNHIKPN